MTLDEIISNAEYCADVYEKMNKAIHPTLQVSDYKRHAEDHRQLAEWLKDYKRLKEQEPFPRGQECGKDGKVYTTEAERVIYKNYLEDLDKNGTCNEYIRCINPVSLSRMYKSIEPILIPPRPSCGVRMVGSEEI